MLHSKSSIEPAHLATSHTPSLSLSGTGFKLFRVPWVNHLLAWLLFYTLLMSLYFFSKPHNNDQSMPPGFVYRTGIQFVLLIGLFYFNAYYAIPRLLFRKKIGWFITVLLLALMGFQFLNGLASFYYFKNMPQEPKNAAKFQNPDKSARNQDIKRPSKNRFGPRYIDPFALLVGLLMLGISTSLTVTLKWFRDNENQKTLEQDRLASELALLKNQINPHFFFNTLNNIYALTEINPIVAQEAIYNLSKMMRYMLYETENDQVQLSKEIDFIHNYVELMRLRLSDTVLVEFSHPETVGNLTIAPLIFITFIENAFKHGVSYSQKSYVLAQLQVEGKSLQFSVKNRLVHTGKATNLEDSGIGMANVKRRLNLLYPERHQLSTDIQGDEYILHLTIQLS